MFRTAVIYSGQTRTFAQTFPNQWWHVLRRLTNPTIFVSVADDPQAVSMKQLSRRFDMAHMEVVTQPEIPEPPPDPKWLAMYPPSSPPQAILRQLWSLNRAWEFFNERAKIEDFDFVVRLRPDLAFARFEKPSVGMRDCVSPWWARWGGVNDRIAMMSANVARHYFQTFLHLDELREKGCPLHPETLIHASLELGGVNIRHTLATEFATIRLDGKVVGVDISDVDAVEYARTKP